MLDAVGIRPSIHPLDTRSENADPPLLISLFTRVASAVALVVIAAIPLLGMGGMPGENANEVGLDTSRPPEVARIIPVDGHAVLPAGAIATLGFVGSGPEDRFLPVPTSSSGSLSTPSEPDPSPIAAQVPPPNDKCHGCLWQDLGGMCGRQKVCKEVPGPDGTNDCRDVQLPGEFPCSTCDDDYPVCTPPPRDGVAEVEDLDAFASGRMLRANGQHYIGVRGDQFVLRRKCSGAAVASVLAADVGARAPSMVLAGG